MPFSFLFFFCSFSENCTYYHMDGGEKQGTPQETNSREYIESSHQQVFCRIFFLILIRIILTFIFHSRSIIIIVVIIIIILPATSCIGNSAFFSIESLFAHWVLFSHVLVLRFTTRIFPVLIMSILDLTYSGLLETYSRNARSIINHQILCRL